jgi:hypothetical protein
VNANALDHRGLEILGRVGTLTLDRCVDRTEIAETNTAAV